MSYRELLLRQIKDLEQQIEKAQGDKTMLQNQLQKLMVAEFEESERESDGRQLLKE
jgi:conjugal transfer/entry exclusion protein